MKKEKLLFDIRDFAITVFICAGILFPTSYIHNEELLINVLGKVIILSIITSCTLNLLCNKYLYNIRKKRNIKKNHITKEMYRKVV